MLDDLDLDLAVSSVRAEAVLAYHEEGPSLYTVFNLQGCGSCQPRLDFSVNRIQWSGRKNMKNRFWT